jgi:thiol-disulfide isomerase/thioredoxin
VAEPVRDAAYDLMARRYLDKDALLPIIRIGWAGVGIGTTHAESFLRAAVERSPNPKVQALACLSLARYQQKLIEVARDLDHPVRGEAIRDWLGPERVRRLRDLKPEDLRREAEALYERTIKEYGDMQPMGKAFPPLGEQARGDLFKLHHLEPGRTAPEIDREDIDGRPMKLSDFHGKVVALSFWATWCGPCMGMVPHEKALVGRMKGRPFVLVGVNGDTDRSQAKEIAAKEGINWRSFWDAGRPDGIAVGWGINAWPTVYLIDARGVIRDSGSDLRGAALDKAVADLVAEAEAAVKKP